MQTDRDLIIESTPDGLELVKGFEGDEIGALGYPDGHTYAPSPEISTTAQDRKVNRTIN